MTKLRYVGAHDSVDVPLPDGRTATVPFRGHLETSPAHAKSLLEQEDNWTLVEPPKKDGDSKSDAKKEG